MTGMTYAIIIFALLFFLIFFGVPIAYSIELSVVGFLLITGLKPMIIIPQKMEIGMDTFVYLAIPLFTFAGYLMEPGRSVRASGRLCGKVVRMDSGKYGYHHNYLLSVFCSIDRFRTGYSCRNWCTDDPDYDQQRIY